MCKIGFLKKALFLPFKHSEKGAFVDDGNAQLVRLGQLGAGIFPAEDERGLFRYAARCLAAMCADEGFGPAAGKGRQRAGDDDGLPGERAAGRALFGRCQPHACRIEPFEQPRGRSARKKGNHGRGALRTDFVDGAELLLGRLRERVKRAEGLGQQLSGLFTDMPDAERVQEYGKRRGLGAFKRGNQVGGALFGEALQRRKVGSFQ